MKRTIIKWALLAVVLAIIVAGCCFLAWDYETKAATWVGLLAAALCIILGLWLGHYLDSRNLLPE